MADPLTGSQLLEAMKSYASGVIKGNTADTLGAPVDMVNAALRPITERLGMYSESPVGGSNMFRKVLGQNVEDANIAETAGSMLSIGGPVKAAIGAGAALTTAMKLGVGGATKTKEATDKLQRGMIVAAEKLDATGKVDLPLAKDMQGEKILNKADIYNNTGVYSDKGVNKAVISDKNAKIIPNSMGSYEQPSSLAGVLDHPELFNLYPELKKTSIYYDKNLIGSPTMGQYWAHSNEIGVRPDITGNELKSVILHEVQHRIQNIEGWQSGGNIRQFTPFDPKSVQQKINDARASGDPALKEAADRFATVATMKLREAGNRYSNLPGEQEARYTQDTMNMDLPTLANDVLTLIRSGNTPATYDTRPIRPVFGGGDVYFKP
jgi:hypothetical protein